ncbi:ricin-type beta-trefoil lectin domain protein [Zooshikella ganghwensis]|uniref:ricin-type beta-trefoil lectin domain protein n=1 Tax=Zooshikella ganghwensis TaxID=202772 RepID=UPI00042996F8|nr:ricin-type beta-trefoil lectin domain protein [Zooshikella ganghwensis]
MINKPLRLAALTLAMSPTWLLAGVNEEIDTYMNQFHQDPAATMDQLPPKTGHANTLFSDTAVNNRNYIQYKDQARQKIMRGNSARLDIPRAPINYSNDNPARLVDLGNNVISNLYTLDNEAPKQRALEVQPWSDTYWPLYSGAAAWRYADSDLWRASPSNWKDYWDFSYVTKPVSSYYGQARDNLSPAEKYDLLMGDSSFTLTTNAWNSGKGYYERSGKVERWMGLCHGWAPAAYMLPRPIKTLNVKDASGEDLTLYPSDIKALATLLWANARFDNRFIGSRCNIKNPERDSNGRIINNVCFDTNPGSWHISVVNQIGISGRSLIMDATYDYQVWNQPIQSYKVTYFNPQTNATYASAQAATIPLSSYTKDKFSNYRGNQSTHVVGVRMDVSYVVETNPTHRRTDSPQYDGITRVSYYYDLELNDQGKILGGEWYSNRHPDFLWTPTPNAMAQSWQNGSGKWSVGQSVPEKWKNKAKQASRYGQPLTSVVNELFTRASEDSNTPSDTWREIVSSDGYCMDVADSGTTDGNLILAWDCHSGNNQKWWQDSYGRLRPAHATNMCATAKINEGGKLVIERCNNSRAQRWQWNGNYLRNLANFDLSLTYDPTSWQVMITADDDMTWSWR